MTTTKFATERVVIECDGACLTITSVGDDRSDRRDNLCIELVTTEEDDDAGLAPYCPDLAQAAYPRPVNRAAKSGGRGRALRAVAIAVLVASACVVKARDLGPAAATPTTVPAAVASTNRTDTDPATSRALVAAASDLAARCTEMIHAASTALGTSDAGLVRTLVAAYRGRTLNDAVHQELTSARARLVAGLARSDANPRQALVGLDALDSALAEVDTTPCSGPDHGPTQ
jgi:hypothetical protein